MQSVTTRCGRARHDRPALMTGARLFYFGSTHGAADVRLFAARHQVRLIVLPDDLHRLREILTRHPSPTREQVPG